MSEDKQYEVKGTAPTGPPPGGWRDEEPTYIPAKGGCCYAPTFGMFVYITRVSKYGEWADIRVSDNAGAEWRKRQPLRDGRFPFVVHPVSAP